MKDPAERWQFLGEGPEEGEEHGHSRSVEAQVIWDTPNGNEVPLEIRFRCEDSYETDEEIEGNLPGKIKTNEYLLAGKFPAQPERVK